jgi:hypothetical protein
MFAVNAPRLESTSRFSEDFLSTRRCRRGRTQWTRALVRTFQQPERHQPDTKSWALRGSNPRQPACKYDADVSRRMTTNDYSWSEPASGHQRTATNGSDRAINARCIASRDGCAEHAINSS